jgi:hypothetical protein
MAIEEYAAAEQALGEAIKRCQTTLGRVDSGLVRPDEAASWVNEYMLELVAFVDDAFTSAPDPRDNPSGLVAHTLQRLEEIAALLDNHPAIPTGTSHAALRTSWFIESRVAQADEVVRMIVVVISWEQATPALAPLRVRRQALASLDEATQMVLKGGFLARMVRAGMRAFGPRWAVNLAAHYLDQHLTDRSYWDLVLVAMDEISAWAAATDLHGIPDEFQRRAISALIEIAGHPDLTEWAVSRIPMHRLSQADRRELGELLADRYEVMPIDWVSDTQEDGTVAIEVAYLQSLERTVASWPGAAERAQ